MRAITVIDRGNGGFIAGVKHRSYSRACCRPFLRRRREMFRAQIAD